MKGAADPLAATSVDWVDVSSFCGEFPAPASSPSVAIFFTDGSFALKVIARRSTTGLSPFSVRRCALPMLIPSAVRTSTL